MNPSWLKISKWSVLFLFIVTSFFVLAQFKKSQHFPINEVKVYGIQHASHADVQQFVLPHLTHGFFSVDVSSIKESLLQVPWISEVVVRRVWPDKIAINLTEKEAIARFNHQSLLSKKGEIFSPALSTYPDGLPELIGPEGQQLVMLQNYEQIQKIIEELHSNIVKLELTPFDSWSIQLANGIKIKLGHKEILTRLDHFVKVYPKIVGNKIDDVDYVDLEYTNGLAVHWKKH